MNILYEEFKFKNLKDKKKIVFVFMRGGGVQVFCLFLCVGGGGVAGGTRASDFFTKNPNLKIYFY